jgi:hypothetical protein
VEEILHLFRAVRGEVVPDEGHLATAEELGERLVVVGTGAHGEDE